MDTFPSNMIKRAKFGAVVPNASGGRVSSDPTTESSWGKGSTANQLDQELGLRHAVAQEFFSADKKIWGAITQLYSHGSWTFEECLNEMTVVRSDISSLFQPRPRVPKTLPPPRDGKGKGGKGKGGKGAGGEGKTKSHFFDKRNQCTYGFNNNHKVTLCMKYNAGECKRDNCHYFHACSVRLQSGRPCMQNHPAKAHKGST